METKRKTFAIALVCLIIGILIGIVGMEISTYGDDTDIQSETPLKVYPLLYGSITDKIEVVDTSSGGYTFFVMANGDILGVEPTTYRQFEIGQSFIYPSNMIMGDTSGG